jgi:L-iditol 2-dehydrogenase
MSAAVLHGVEDVRLEDRPTPTPGPGEVLVEVRAVGVCGSDIHYYREGRIGEHVVTAPLVLGHEAAGVVVATGPDVDLPAPGDRVALEPGVPCRRCRECREGRYNLCPDVRFLATPPIDGAFCRYVVSPADFAHRVPDTLTDDAAALLEPLSVAVWACWKAAVRAGDRVLVTGAGPIGLLVAQVARASGAVEVTVSDVVPQRLAAAADLGATRTLDPSRESPPTDVDVLLECSGVPAAVDAGLRAVRPAGRAVLVGMAPAPVTPLPTQVIQNREITVTGTFRYAGTYPTAIGLAASGAVELDRLVSGRYGLAETEDALRAAILDPAAIKAIVVPTQPS